MRQRSVFLAVSAALLAWMILFTGTVRPVRAVRLAPEIGAIISEEGEAAFYRFFDGLQTWYAAHPQTAGGVTLTMERDYDQLSEILRDGAICIDEAQAALEQADPDLQEWANSYLRDLAFYIVILPLGPMLGLGQNETVELDRETWTALGETIDALVDCYQ